MFMTYAGPKLPNNIRATLQRKFSKISKRDRPKKIVVAPAFDPSKRLAFEHREIPTAYIKLKFNAPSITAKDAPAADLMFEILSERLQEEIRTKRSLSYAVYAGTIQYNQGIGIISVSTSKPKETIDAIASVVKDFKAKGVTAEELNEQRNVFTTSYFQTLESQNSLAGALSSFQNYFGNARKLYELPSQLAGVTPADVSRIAKEWLKNFRVGVVYDKAKFDSKWLKQLESL
jgi:predicted Zn-dependent peptidase